MGFAGNDILEYLFLVGWQGQLVGVARACICLFRNAIQFRDKKSYNWQVG
jgi:hypothetical protein